MDYKGNNIVDGMTLKEQTMGAVTGRNKRKKLPRKIREQIFRMSATQAQKFIDAAKQSKSG
jgi:hypothetical protein